VEISYWNDYLRGHYLDTGAIKQIAAQDAQHISRSFLVEKSSGGFRLVVDLRHVNSHFEPPKTKFETLAQLRYCSDLVSLGVTIDVTDAYHHIKIHENI
jgi:hypothetical protein